jgi:hypothetical protein
MSRRNRKKTQAGFKFPAPLALTLVVMAGISLVYVCMQSRTEALGREIKQLEAQRDQLREKVVKEQCEWARMQSPANVEKALKEHGLVMTWPGRDQIVRMRADGSIDTMMGPEPRAPGRYARVDRIVMND